MTPTLTPPITQLHAQPRQHDPWVQFFRACREAAAELRAARAAQSETPPTQPQPAEDDESAEAK